MLGFLLCASNASAFYCSEPRDPQCPVLGKFDSDFDFEMCKAEMERYQRSLRTYADCIDDAKTDALDRYNKAVKRFNCAASGEQYCF